MLLPAPLPASLCGHPFALPDSDAAGVSRRRTRASDLLTPCRGIRFPTGSPLALAERLQPYLRLTPGAVVSHLTAARLYGVPLPARFEEDATVHLTRPRGSAAPRRRDVSGHQRRLRSADVGLVSGVPVTSPARTWLDLALLLPPDELVVAGDYLVCEHARGFMASRRALVTKDRLAAYVAAHPGVRGVKTARAALELVEIGVDSAPETRLRLLLDRALLPRFEVNYPLTRYPEDLPVWVDLACPAYRTCVEYEGAHHLTPERQAADRGRDQRVADCGWQQVKIYAADMAHGPEWVAGLVRQALVRGGWRRR